MMALIISILKLAGLILGEYFQAKKRAREAQEEYEVDLETFEELARKAVAKMRTQVSQDSRDVGTMDDVMDDYIRNSEATKNSKEE